MNLLAHLNRSVHQLQDSLHLHWPQSSHPRGGSAGGGVVLTVALLSVAAASILVLAP